MGDKVELERKRIARNKRRLRRARYRRRYARICHGELCCKESREHQHKRAIAAEHAEAARLSPYR